MATKQFRTRRQWHNTVIALLAVPVMLLAGVLLFAITGKQEMLVGLLLFSTLAVLAAWVRDARAKVSYELSNGLLSLRRSNQVLDIPVSEVLDVSLIDRTGARAFVEGSLLQGHGHESGQLRESMHDVIRFCTVDIGLTSLTFGLGRYVIDQLPKARKDLVLLRLRNGQAHILSPEYNQDLIASVTAAQGH